MTEFEDEKDAVEFKAQGEPRFLLYPAAGDIDEVEGLTELEMLEMLAAELGYTLSKHKLEVAYGPMPESNGKTNWTAILHAGDIVEGITLDRSEYPDRVRYEADRARYLIGEIEERPRITDYDANKHSGYVALKK